VPRAKRAKPAERRVYLNHIRRLQERNRVLGEMHAATEWMKFDPDSVVNLGMPQPGEWCLWSFVTKHGREYYSGSWFEWNGKKVIRTEYGWTAELVDAYFARVNKLPQAPTLDA
jgi:hypothetical protein